MAQSKQKLIVDHSADVLEIADYVLESPTREKALDRYCWTMFDRSLLDNLLLDSCVIQKAYERQHRTQTSPTSKNASSKKCVWVGRDSDIRS